MLGGGNFTSQNKILPGSYINVVSAKAFDLNSSSRGVASIGMEFDWCPDDEIFSLNASEFERNALKIFGYSSTDEKLKDVREIFKHATTVHFYKLNVVGAQAFNDYADAKHKGVRGNQLKTVIQNNVDKTGYFDVITYLDTTKVDTQTVKLAKELVDNDFVTFKKDATLKVTASTPLIGGTNGGATGESHQAYLNALESCSFNVFGTNVYGADDTQESVKKLYSEFTKRMRNEVGAKFQCVLFKFAGNDEGIINVKNSKDLVPWVIGAEAGCTVNSSCTNKVYDGEVDITSTYTQTQLEDAILAGEFTFHKCGDDYRVLTDINSLTTVTESKGAIFKNNQTIRVIDYIANESAGLFNNKYLGKVLNNGNGRASFWSELVDMHKELQNSGAIEDFSDDSIAISSGNKKGSVVVSDIVTIAGTMEQLYMTVTIQ